MEHNKASLFKLYIKLRQNGLSLDEVVNSLQECVENLSKQERHQLGELVTEWEAKYGSDPRASLEPIPALQFVPTQVKQVESPVGQHIPRLLANQPTTAMPRLLDPSKATQLPRESAPQPISCPYCGVLNPPQRLSCHACAQPLRVKSAPATRRLNKSTSQHAHVPPDFFGPDSILLVTIRGKKGVLEAFPREKMVIGRGISPVPKQPFLDLAPFDGEALGVSRAHVEIRCLNDTLVATDLDSDNGTFINGVRLHPFEIRVLHHNDELRLGKLVMKVSFKVPV